ncbi:trans-sulfuration enzyme family protein [Meiothermus cerbereus]|jgi:methionine-gamma-lyase|uniref:trans-sulfuration enzyme family protein n=1 Tax=Meiothermus cerbereus TaxID=65552 RepID=UPI00048758B8|nr:PLP-dependent aspartate aminotransferase family protein [Meiothermus cerbereus]
MKIRTRAVHAGHHPDRETGAHVVPIYSTSTFAYGSFARGERLFAGEEPGYIYGRIGNPTVRAFEEKLASLEGAEDAVAFASGMAAISALCNTLLAPGDEIVYLAPLYGGTEGYFLETLTRFGVRVTGGKSVEELPELISPATRLIYLETPTNPTLRIYDLEAVARIARARGVLSVVDNTFATPYLTRPLEHGIEVVLHSATKYLGGHGDCLAGVLAGPKELMEHIRAEGLRHIGAALGAFEAYLMLRGLKTLPLRMEAHCEGAARVAEYLSAHPAVQRVHYPGLSAHPGHEVAKRQMQGFGGLVSLELESKQAAALFLDSLKLFTQAVSLGDVESLATHPASTTHQLLPPEVRQAHGVSDALVRLSVGIEDPQDLIADLEQALDQVAKALLRSR